MAALHAHHRSTCPTSPALIYFAVSIRTNGCNASAPKMPSFSLCSIYRCIALHYIAPLWQIMPAPVLDKGLDLEKFSKRNYSYSRSLLDYQDFQENFLILLSIYEILFPVSHPDQHFDLILRLSPLIPCRPHHQQEELHLWIELSRDGGKHWHIKIA